MVQLWPGIPPEVLCDMYLNSCLNEGLNLLIRHHMAKGHRIDGWIRNGCIYATEYTLTCRIGDLIGEMKKRGKNWNYSFCDSDLDIIKSYNKWINPFDTQHIDALELNPQKLLNKCCACRYRETKCKGKETCEDRLKARGMI